MERTGFVLILLVMLAAGSASYMAAAEVENLIINPEFERTLQEWHLEVHGDFVNATMELDKEGVPDKRCVRIDIHHLEPGAEMWRLQFKQVGHKVKNGQKYTWTFWAMAEEMRPADLLVCMEVDPWDNLGGSKPIVITDQWKEYQLTFRANQDFHNTRLSIQLAGSDVPVWIDHVKFYEGDYVEDKEVNIKPPVPEPEPKKGNNLIQNSEFDMGTAFWNLEVHTDFVNAIMLEDRIDAIGDNRCARIDISKIEPGSEVWRLQFKQYGHSVKGGTTYTWSFWAKTEDWREATVWVGMEADPWAVLGALETIELESEWQEYHFTFPASQDYDNTRLSIQLAGSPETVWVDHVRFYEGDYEEEDFEEIMKQRSVTPAGKLSSTWGKTKSSAR